MNLPERTDVAAAQKFTIKEDVYVIRISRFDLRKKVVLFAVVLAFTGSAQAYTCEGPVTGVTVGPPGKLASAEIAGLQWPYLCELSGNSEANTTTETCKAIYALLLTAQTSGKHVRLWFSDSGDCTTNSHPA